MSLLKPMTLIAIIALSVAACGGGSSTTTSANEAEHGPEMVSVA